MRNAAMILLGAALVLAALSLRPAPAPREVPVEPAIPPRSDPVAEFQAYLKSSPPAAELAMRIQQFSVYRRPEVPTVLTPLLRSPLYGDEVKIAVCRTIGKQGYKTVAGLLLAMIDSKAWEEKPKLIAAAIEGVGDADPVGRYKEVMKLAKKHLDRDAVIACAAYRAASRKNDREAVDDLIRELGRASFTREDDDPRKKAAHRAVRPVLVEILKSMTGVPLDEAPAWAMWWTVNGRTWRPGAPAREVPPVSECPDFVTDEAHGFELRRPGGDWEIRRSEWRQPGITIETLRDGRRVAGVEVFTAETAKIREKTPEAWAGVVRGQLTSVFHASAGAEWERPCTYAGLKGVEQVLDGHHAHLGPVRMRNVFIEKEGTMIYLLCTWQAETVDLLEPEVMAILGSFRLTR